MSLRRWHRKRPRSNGNTRITTGLAPPRRWEHTQAMNTMTAALLLFPHQLFKSNLDLASGMRRVYMIEEPLYFLQFRFHQQKLMLHRASMRMHAHYLRCSGAEIEYIECHAAGSMSELLTQIARAQI